MKLYVRRGSEVFRDDLLWNVNNPCNTSYAYAARVSAASVDPNVNTHIACLKPAKAHPHTVKYGNTPFIPWGLDRLGSSID